MQKLEEKRNENKPISKKEADKFDRVRSIVLILILRTSENDSHSFQI